MKKKSNFVQTLIDETNNLIFTIRGIKNLLTENHNLILKNKALKEDILNNGLSSIDKDMSFSTRYNLIPAKVINNSILNAKNYITINKGRAHGIRPDMGVLSPNGIIGKVKFASENFSTIISILNIRQSTSVVLSECGVMGTMRWDGKDPSEINMLYVPKYANIKIGEDIETSAYNQVYPKGIKIGKVIEIDDNRGKLFYDLKVKLYTEFSSISNVFVVVDYRKAEILNMEKKTKNFYE